MAELNIQFGQIPFWAICAFGEITKIEITVFSFICAKRFRNNCEADCARQEIIEYTKLDKSQVSLAIRKLVSIKWLQPKSKTKWFIPETKPEKVDDSSTNKTELVYEYVEDSTTKVDDFSTKVDDSSTSHNKDISSYVSHEQTKKRIAAKRGSTKKPKQFKSVKARPPEYDNFKKRLYEFHKQRINAIPNPAAQYTAIAWLFDHAYILGDCLTLYSYQVKQLKPQGWRDSVSWLTVQQQISDWVSQGKPKLDEVKNGSGNGHNLSKREQSAINDYQLSEQIRARVNARKAG